MARKIQFKRGLKVNLPKLSPAEMAFTTDEKKVYIGDGNENIRLLDQKDKAEIATQLADIVFNAKSYGAKGDGTTLDTLLIQAMLVAARGQRCFLPAGIYIVENLMFPEKFDLVLDSNATLKLKNGSASSAMLNVGNVIKGKISGGTIDGNKENITARVHTIVGTLPTGTSLEIENVHFKNISDHGTYITNFGGYLGIEHCLFTDQGEHRGTNDTSTCVASVMSGQVGAKGFMRFNHNRAYFTKQPRTDGSNPGGVFFAPTTEYKTGTGNFSTFEAIGNYFYGYGQHLANNDIAPLHTYPSTEGARFIGNYFEKCGFCAIAAKSVKDFVCSDNVVIDGMISYKNAAAEGAISYAPGYHAGNVQRPRGIISNNIVTNPGGEPDKKQVGIAVLAVPTSIATDVIVSGNILTDCGMGITANYVTDIKIIDNIINGASGGTAGTEMGIRLDNANGEVFIKGNTIKSLNGHGIYCMTGSQNAKFIILDNVFKHSADATYACILRGVNLAKFSGNSFFASAGYVMNLAASGSVKVEHFSWDASNSILEGTSIITWAGINKVSGELSGTNSPVGTITPLGAGHTFTNTTSGTVWVSTGNTANDWSSLNGASNSGGIPTITVGTDAPGAGGTATISGNDTEGQITVTVGTSPGATGGGIAAVRFGNSKSTPPKGVMLTPGNGNALAKNNAVVVYNTTLTTIGFSLSAVGSLNANLTYAWYYRVLA